MAAKQYFELSFFTCLYNALLIIQIDIHFYNIRNKEYRQVICGKTIRHSCRLSKDRINQIGTALPLLSSILEIIEK